MSDYGQFCSVARALELLGGRWTLLVVRELLSGSRRFNDIRRGVPRISRTMLSQRLQALMVANVVVRAKGPHGPEYGLTSAGRELAAVVVALGAWGQRWLPRNAADEDLDAEPVFVDMQRRVRRDLLPTEPIVIRFDIDGRRKPRFLLLRPGEVSLCTQNPGFPEAVLVSAALAVLVGWWRGDISFLQARRAGLRVEGSGPLVKAFPTWFERYQLAHIAPILEAKGRQRGNDTRLSKLTRRTAA